MSLIRASKILLVSAVAFFGFLGIFNFLGWDAGYRSVEGIVSMADVPESARTFAATSNPVIITLGVLFIGLSKIVGGALCALGAVSMWHARHAPTAEFQAAKTYALVGCAVLIFLFVFGFMYLAGQFFMGWRTDFGAASSAAAFRFAGSVAIVLIFVNQPD